MGHRVVLQFDRRVTAMASSVQFTIRDLMAITVAVAIVTAATAPAFHHLDPNERPQAVLYLSLLGVAVVAITGKGCVLRRRVEKAAGPLISRTGIGGSAIRWASLIAAIPLSALAVYGTILLATTDVFANKSAGIMTGCSTLCFGFTATGLCLHWWWGTGFVATEAFQNGLVVHGLALMPWSTLASYTPSPRRSTTLIVNRKTRRGLRPFRIRVAPQDRAEWERLLVEHGVALVRLPVDDGDISQAGHSE